MVLQLSHSLFSKLNELQSGWLTSVSLITLHYTDACIKAQIAFPNVFMFCFKQMHYESPSGEQTNCRDQASKGVWMDHPCVSSP